MSNIQVESFETIVVSDMSNNSAKVSQNAAPRRSILEPAKLLFLKNRLQTTSI